MTLKSEQTLTGGPPERSKCNGQTPRGLSRFDENVNAFLFLFKDGFGLRFDREGKVKRTNCLCLHV